MAHALNTSGSRDRLCKNAKLAEELNQLSALTGIQLSEGWRRPLQHLTLYQHYLKVPLMAIAHDKYETLWIPDVAVGSF